MHLLRIELFWFDLVLVNSTVEEVLEFSVDVGVAEIVLQDLHWVS